MKSLLRVVIPVLFSISLSNTYAQSDFYSRRWSAVYKYELKVLTASALAVTDSIYSRAKREKNIPQLAKALLYQSKFALTLKEDAELLVVQKFEKEIRESKAPLTNLLESVLANVYWQYFKENRWKYYQRTETENKVDVADFCTWDTPTMFREIHLHFQRSLQNASITQKVSLATINDLLIEAENSKQYRPTLYDFLAHQALDFYQSGESSVTRPIGNFNINDPRYFEEFESMIISDPDSLSPQLQSLKIFQQLLSFHKKAKDTVAYLNLELERLEYLLREGFYTNRDELHQKALSRLRAVYSRHPMSASIDFELATLADKASGFYDGEQSQFKKREALELCDKAIAAFPNSDGAEKCLLLKRNILAPKLAVQAERFTPINTPSRVLITYTNVDSLYLSAYVMTPAFAERFYSVGDSAKYGELEKLTPQTSWAVALKDLRDHLSHQTEIVVPALPAGKYMLVARTHKRDKKNHEQMYAYAEVQATNLALLQSIFQSGSRYQVVDRNNGKPIEGADVHFKTYKNYSGAALFDQHFKTDKEGFFEVKNVDNYYPNLQATIRYQNEQAEFGEYYFYESHESRPRENYTTAKVFLFTDRSIYRPGQTVYFKGIMIKRTDKKSSIVPGQYVEVILEDVNGEEAGFLRLKTNHYGSFSGEFKLPATGLTGEYILSADEDTEGESNFYDNLDSFEFSEQTVSVEEYKRPTFEASFKPVEGEFALNDTVRVIGTALAYNGSKISNAKVSYHVKRTVRYPRWYYWYDHDTYSEAEEITFGETTTNKDGEFTIDFKAIPDEKVSPDQRPVFHYAVSVDVTDLNGETRNANSAVKAGYHSLIATINAAAAIDRKVSENTITITTENLNDQHVPAKGSIQIHKLQSPAHPLRARPWPAPDLKTISEEEFKKLFPHDAYEDESDPKQWKKGRLMFESAFDTGKSKEIKFNVNRTWELGSYIIELTTTDSRGQKVTDLHRFKVVELGNKTVADNQLLIFETDKNSYKVGELMKLKIGSASKDITVTVDIEKNHKIAKTYIEHLSGEVKQITIPVTENFGNGFAIHCTAVIYNDFKYEKELLPIVTEVQQMEIETITFKDKLQPGAKETWSFEIKGSNPAEKEAEVLASMYDASLDQFKPHEWTFNPEPRGTYYSLLQTSAHESFGDIHFSIGNPVSDYYDVGKQYYDQLDWFGFTLSDNYYVKQQYLNRLYSAGVDPNNPPKVTMSNTRHGKKGYIYGRITDDSGQGLPGVNIVIKGTTIGTVSDGDGKYTLEADKGDVIVYSFVGYSTTEAQVGRKNTIDVAMQADVTALSEVVVTAYGVPVAKNSLGYAIAEVVADTTASDVAFTTALEGRVAGIQITGMPGGPVKLFIRGNSTAPGSDPLYVVDGVVVESSKIDQEDVASIQVLKGAAATALYGAKAANGVMVITTKSGQKKLDEELAKVNARKNFNETAFFFPHLSTDMNGRVRFTFTTPESLTRWKLQLLAYNKNLVSATKTLQTVTQKELMVTPNAPRFMRTGDEITFSTKIVNLTARSKEGKIALQLTNAVTGESVDPLFANIVRNQVFKVEGKATTEVSWKLKVPQGIDAIQYKIVAKAGNHSDGEQNVLPVLSNRMLVTETMPMYVLAGQTKTFTLNKLKTVNSPSLQHHQVTLEITSNPAWYAIQTLPYLMEFPHECAEQLFSRYYANALAGHVANSSPKIKEVFSKWSSSNALISNLEKNQDLKSVIIQETPWLRDAQSETEQKKRIALLFDLNTLKDHQQSALNKLQAMQMSSGGFSWFSGGRYESRYITQHVACGFGHLKQLKVPVDENMQEIVNKAVIFLDGEINKEYKRLLEAAQALRMKAKNQQEGEREAQAYLQQQHIYNEQIQYLYMRSFYPEIQPGEETNSAINYYRDQTAKYWTTFNLYTKGMIALIQHRNKNTKLSTDIIRSLKETSIVSEELGMYWKENVPGWYWYQAPVETQALMIEAFAEIEADDTNLSAQDKRKTIDELRIWLLKNKQTNQWRTTKATSEAIYALLLNGTDWLELDNQIEVTVADKKVEPDNKQPEAGTGYFKTSWKNKEVAPDMGTVTFTKKDNGIAWGGLYWQYFEDLDKITPAETPLKLSKKVFLVTRANSGELLKEVSLDAPLKVGDLLRIRIELKADRDMEFLHMKDMRAAGLEPVDVLSEYKWQDNLGYYQSTKDASTNFFFDYVPKGVFVFEYDLRVNNKGNFSNGITTIQCMYAPEFSSHSEGVRIKVD